MGVGGRCGGVGAYSRLGAYSRWALIRGWALIRINTVSITKTNCAILWIVIYPVDSAIHLSNNRGQVFFVFTED